MTTTSYSDLVRTGLLAAHGGVWVDATLYCVRPLDSWLPAVAATGFFAFRLKSQRPLATWLIAAEPAHPLIDAWAAQARSYWIDRDRFDTYFWLHQQFAQCCLNSPALARAWGDVPEVPAGHAHAFWPAERTLMRPMPAELRRRIDMRLDPVYKLSHRVPSRFPPGSAGEFFLRFVPARAPSPAKN